MVSWLASWLSKEERVKYESWQKNIPWPPDMIESVIVKSLEVSCSNLLFGFKLFLPVCDFLTIKRIILCVTY